MARPTPEEKLLIDERRRKVTALWLSHVTQEEIARQIGVSQKTVSVDIKAIREEYKADRTEMIDREAAELDHIERECALRYRQDKAGEWLDRRLKVKDRRAKLLGLDAPAKIDARSEVTGSIRLGWDDGPNDTDESGETAEQP